MWVRPILTMSFHALALASIASRSAFTAGISRCLTVITAAAMYIAEGNESFDDCDMLTWSLGWTGVLLPSGVPASWQQRLRDHLVDVHVELGAAAGHPDVQRKHVVVLAGQDLVADLDDQAMYLVVEPLAGVIGVGRRLLQDGVGR